MSAKSTPTAPPPAATASFPSARTTSARTSRPLPHSASTSASKASTTSRTPFGWTRHERKIHTHGAGTKEDADEILGPELDQALTYMERAYNDGAHYVLHYVTAREAFNLARAAVDGKQGDPRQYYDYLIPRYLANGGR